MKESAVSEKKVGSVSAQRAKKAASLTRDGLKVADRPLMSIVQRAGCRDCGPSVQSLAGGMMQTPVAQRQAAAMSLQRVRGNRFVQRMAVQERPAAGGAIAAKSASPVVQRYVKVGLYEGSFGLDHIGVGVNSEKTKGFSPKPGLGRKAENGSWVQGEVKEDHDQIDSLTIRTSPSQEARLKDALNRSESSSQKFNLYQLNCAQHGAEILNSAGLGVKSSPLPRVFFEGLKRHYASGPGEAAADGEPVQGKFESGLPAAESAQPVPRPNRTGMPDQLKAGIELLSGIDMSEVRVHANSDRPARLNALAYTEGSQIYLGPGQERHLPHEAWHVVQQTQGHVRATTKIKGVRLNDDPALERDADSMASSVLERGSSREKGDDTFLAFTVKDKQIVQLYVDRWTQSLRSDDQATTRSHLLEFGGHRNLDVNPDIPGRGGIYTGSARTDDPPFIRLFHITFNRLHSWDLYMKHNHSKHYTKFLRDTEILKIYEYVRSAKEKSKIYKAQFRTTPDYIAALVPEAYERKQANVYEVGISGLIRDMENLETICVQWYRDNIKKGERAYFTNISAEIHETGTRDWRSDWLDAVYRVNTILDQEWKIHKPALERWIDRINKQRTERRRVRFPGMINDITYIGSTATGYKGIPKQHVRFDPKKFDVDANIRADPLAAYAVHPDGDGLQVDRDRIFARNTSISPLINFCDIIDIRLKKEVPGIEHNTNEKFDVAIIIPNDIYRRFGDRRNYRAQQIAASLQDFLFDKRRTRPQLGLGPAKE